MGVIMDCSIDLTGSVIAQTSMFRRGQLLSWEWGDTGIGPNCRAAGMTPLGAIVTAADEPDLKKRIGLKVAGGVNFLLDPVKALAEGKEFRVVQDGSIPRVLNAHKVGKTLPGAVYIGRPSEFGNPFSIGKDGTRDEVLNKYLTWLHESPDFVKNVRIKLAGKDLICWCDPASCHGHILRDIALGGEVPEPQSLRQEYLL